MSKLVTKKSDVIWNYVGTAFSLASGFILLPVLILFLSEEELGLWYAFLAVANLALLFEFGFSPTFARNITYVVSGARKLSSEGIDSRSVGEGIDWHLLNVVIKTSKLVYIAISLIVLLGLITIGTVYIFQISAELNGISHWIAWGIICVSVFFNLYFYWTTTVLRGYGDVAGGNKATAFARGMQIIVSAFLLMLGYGLIGATIGYLANSVALRLFGVLELKKHVEFEAGRKSDQGKVAYPEIRQVLGTVGHLAWRDGVVQLALYASTQAMTFFSSLYLGLAESSSYSILLQVGNAICNFAGAYNSSFYPAIQSAYAAGDTHGQQRMVASSVVVYWAIVIACVVGSCAIVFPVLSFVRGSSFDYALFIVMSVYLSLVKHHSIFCNYIIGRNKIPYLGGYVFASVLGAALVAVLCGVFRLGAWGIVFGQLLSQVIYNNWKWPLYYCKDLGISYSKLIRMGFDLWISRCLSGRHSHLAK